MSKSTNVVEIELPKNAIIIKGNVIYRCGTKKTEKGPKSLLDYELPKYGKMPKYVIEEDGIHELTTTEEYLTRTAKIKHTKTDAVVIIKDMPEIDWDLSNTWQAQSALNKKSENTEDTTNEEKEA